MKFSYCFKFSSRKYCNFNAIINIIIDFQFFYSEDKLPSECVWWHSHTFVWRARVVTSRRPLRWREPNVLFDAYVLGMWNRSFLICIPSKRNKHEEYCKEMKGCFLLFLLPLGLGMVVRLCPDLIFTPDPDSIIGS